MTVVGDLLGGNGVTLPVDLGDIDVGVPGVAGVSTSPAQGGGTTVGIELLGGGGGSISTNPLGLLGNGGINVSLPGLGGIGDDDDGNGGGFEFVDNSPEVPCTIGAPLGQNTRVARDCVVGPLVNVEGFLMNDQAAAAYEDMKAAAAADGITLFLVEMGTPGFKRAGRST